jgi:CRP/FNR family transcriptional regulator, cyclic AMP receptor protein
VTVDAAALRRVSFLEPLRDKELQRLARDVTERTVSAGEELVSQGSAGIAFFLILDGTASVLVDGKKQGALGPGDHFGEIALLLPEVAHSRTATVRADTDMRVAGMAEWNFKGFIAEHPEVAWTLLMTLARQLISRAGSESAAEN